MADVSPTPGKPGTPARCGGPGAVFVAGGPGPLVRVTPKSARPRTGTPAAEVPWFLLTTPTPPVPAAVCRLALVDLGPPRPAPPTDPTPAPPPRPALAWRTARPSAVGPAGL